MIVSIQTKGNRIIVADIQDSVSFVNYRRAENQLVIFADDTNPRWTTCAHMLDYSTIVGADKFGSIFVVSV